MLKRIAIYKINKVRFYLILPFLLSVVAVSGNPIQTLDSLIALSSTSSKMDSLFFAKYYNSLDQLSNTTQRFTYSQQGINLANRTKNGDYSALMIQNLGLYYASIDSIKTAARLFKEAYEVSEKKELKRSLAGYTAIYNIIQSEYKTAIDYFLKEIEWSDKQNKPYLKGAAYNNIAEIFLDLKRTDKAKEYALSAYQIDYTGLPEKRFKAYASTIIGQIYQLENQLDSAEFYYKEAIQTMRNPIAGLSKSRYYHINAHCYYHLSHFYRETGNSKLALIYGDTSLMNYNQISDMGFEYSILIYTNLAKCYLSLEQLENAQKAIENIDAKINNGSASFALQKLYYEYKIDYAARVKDYKSAYSFSSKLQEVKDNIYDNEKEQFILLSIGDLKSKEEGDLKTENEYETLLSNYKMVSKVAIFLGFLLIIGIMFFFSQKKR
ncbi:MAG: tetratricopeptide repeat protein [Saprospiraceae bacterium]